MYCSKCGNEVQESHSFCPNCGTEVGVLPASPTGNRKAWYAVFIGVACCFVLLVILLAIDLLRDDTKKEEAQNPGTAAPVTYVENAVDEEAAPAESDRTDAYLWPTDRYAVSYDDLNGYSQEGVAVIRNEIYARHGYIFKTEKWSNYFTQFSWYVPDKNYSDSLMNAMEKANLATIVQYEKDMGWRDTDAPASGSGYTALSGFLWPTDVYYISDDDLSAYSQSQIAVIRNEIYARHGYVFQTEKWRNYFAQFSWYAINDQYSDSLLSEIERANLDTIVTYEQAMGWR